MIIHAMKLLRPLLLGSPVGSLGFSLSSSSLKAVEEEEDEPAKMGACDVFSP